MRSDYHLSGNPMDGPTPRQERAMTVADRVNSIYRRDLGHPRFCRMVTVLRRWSDRAGVYGGADR